MKIKILLQILLCGCFALGFSTANSQGVPILNAIEGTEGGSEFLSQPEPSAPEQKVCRLLSFSNADLVPGFVNGTYVLVVNGEKPYANMDVELHPYVYKKKPNYWKIEVVGCLEGIALPATTPYTKSLEVISITGDVHMGNKGVEIIGVNQAVKLDRPKSLVTGSTTPGVTGFCENPEYIPSSLFHNIEINDFKDITPEGAVGSVLALKLIFLDKEAGNATLDCSGFIKTVSVVREGKCFASLVEDLYGQCEYLAKRIRSWNESEQPCFVYDEYTPDGSAPIKTLQVDRCEPRVSMNSE